MELACQAAKIFFFGSMPKQTEIFEAIVEHRRAVRLYDASKPFDPKVVERCLKLARLAPNSSNLQLWEFHHVRSPQLLEKFGEACLDQPTARTAKELVVFVTRRDLWSSRCKALIENQLRVFGKKPDEKLSTQEKRVIEYWQKIIPALYRDFFGMLGFFKRIFTFFRGLRKATYREVRSSDLRVVAHKSTALAAQTFMLAMSAEGYDTCPVEGFDSKRVKSLFGLPRRAEITMIVTCGTRHPKGIYGDRFRLPFEEVYFNY